MDKSKRNVHRTKIERSNDWETAQTTKQPAQRPPLPHAHTCHIDNREIKNKSPSPTQKRSSKPRAAASHLVARIATHSCRGSSISCISVMDT